MKHILKKKKKNPAKIEQREPSVSWDQPQSPVTFQRISGRANGCMDAQIEELLNPLWTFTCNNPINSTEVWRHVRNNDFHNSKMIKKWHLGLIHVWYNASYEKPAFVSREIGAKCPSVSTLGANRTAGDVGLEVISNSALLFDSCLTNCPANPSTRPPPQKRQQTYSSSLYLHPEMLTGHIWSEDIQHIFGFFQPRLQIKKLEMFDVPIH